MRVRSLRKNNLQIQIVHIPPSHLSPYVQCCRLAVRPPRSRTKATFFLRKSTQPPQSVLNIGLGGMGRAFLNLVIVASYLFPQTSESKKPLFHYTSCLAQVIKAVRGHFHRTAAVVLMAPHFSTFELALVRRWQSAARTAKELWALHKAGRTRRRIKPVCFSAFKKLLNGTTHRGKPETRGRKRKFGLRAVRARIIKRMVSLGKKNIFRRKLKPMSHFCEEMSKTINTMSKTNTKTCKTSKTSMIL